MAPSATYLAGKVKEMTGSTACVLYMISRSVLAASAAGAGRASKKVDGKIQYLNTEIYL